MDNFHQNGSVADYLTALKSSPRFAQQVVHHEELDAYPAAFGINRIEWPKPLEEGLKQMGIDALYQHQVNATPLPAVKA
jgi:DEAD/DEAH box helicase domain-containing protein